MDDTAKLLYVPFFFVFLIWLLCDVLKRRREHIKDLRREKSSIFTKITVSSNVFIATTYLGLCLYEFRSLGMIPLESGLSAITWFSSSVVFIYSVATMRKTWPLILVMWWGFHSVFNLLLLLFVFVCHFERFEIPRFLLSHNVLDFALIPFSTLLCIDAVLSNPLTKKTNVLAQPLLVRETDHSKLEEDPFSSAGIWSHMTFRWLNPLFETGHKKKLAVHDLPQIPRSESAKESLFSVEESLRRHKAKSRSLPNGILHQTWKPLAVNGLFAGMNTVASYIGPMLIPSFLNFLSTKGEESSTWNYGTILALIFFASKTVESLSQRQWYFGARRIGIRLKASLMLLIYKKSLSIKHNGSMSGGKIINYVNVDVERIGDFCWYFHGMWLLPIQIIFALVILYKNLGAVPSIAAFLTTILVMISNTPFSNMQEKLHAKIMEAKDSRIKATSETLKSMRILKLHSWESTFLNKILGLRDTEMDWLKRYLYTSSAMTFLFWASPTLVSVVTFVVCIVMGTPLTSGTVLSALATFRILQEPIYYLPELMSMIAQTKVAIDRVQGLLAEEDRKWFSNNPRSHTASIDCAIEIEPGEYSWQDREESSKRTTTVKITEKINVTKGYKVAICGSIGSGKTSFLHSILGEIPQISGARIKTYGTKAFVPQSAWIQTGTVRDNVLFGKEMNGDLYKNVVEACALNQDFEMWADRDLCVVGERGMNLSGGQKQRIQMARALYCNSDVYLLDDPFSAVDARTGAHMFNKCLMQFLHDKTVIYVTHQLEFLDASDLVLVMKDGVIAESGKYKDLISNQNGELLRQMKAHNSTLDQVKPYDASSCSKFEPVKQTELTELRSDISSGSCIAGFEQNPKEDTESGRVKWRTYSTFVTCAYKGALVPIVLLCHVLFQGLQMASNYWIAWGSEKENNVSNKHLIEIFALLSIGSLSFILGRAILLSTIAIETSHRLFLGMIRSIFRAPLSFFDLMPSSRILSRSSTDQSVVDTDVPYRLAGLIFAIIQLLSIIVLMSHVAWQVFFVFFIVLIVSIWYQTYYINTARELARMLPMEQAPILHHFSESISGLALILCFDQEDRFCEKMSDLIDNYCRVSFFNSGTMEWLCVRINFLFNLVFFLLLIILVNLPKSAIDPSLAGLAATYGLSLNVLQAWVIWNLCNVENKMISVERILEFGDIPSEAPLVLEHSRPDKEWPFNGTIQVENLQVQYKPSLPSVLKGITCVFPGKKKIGIVGRTGSGKSTLIQAFFRVVEPLQGRILIDGVDISKIGLSDLRSRLSIIPQDPVLFQGNLRTNLDPLQQHSDHEIWEVLRKCHLDKSINREEGLLDAPVAEDGENWSVGQRQLVCLARVLLQRRRILVLDEATASVDTTTDNLIQNTISQQTIGRCTVITVAHRIPTVVDSDLVLVLEQGKVVEYDSPSELLGDSNSEFSSLVMDFLRRSEANIFQVVC